MAATRGPFNSEYIEVDYIEVFFPTANAETPVSHRLRGTFLGCTPVRKSATCDIWDGQMPPASNVVHLICDTDGVTAMIRVEALRVPPR